MTERKSELKMSNRKTTSPGVVHDYVKLRELPDFAELSSDVNKVLIKSTWWDLYGVDWAIVLAAILGIYVSFNLLGSDSLINIIFGLFLLGCCNSALSTKGGHCAAHGAVVQSPAWNKFWTIFFVEFVGSFSSEAAMDIHIKYHHPHTNIIGLGDSSTWKMPMLPAYIYMFVAPLMMPLITPLVGWHKLLGRWRKLLQSVLIIFAGLVVYSRLLSYISGISIPYALLAIFGSRAIISIPYIHVNIFQHIGLPMYAADKRPKRIYQMATGVLNLNRNFILDYCFGHGIISCHVEHHLFPRLSDNMCFKIKPLVSKFLKESGLPYNEDAYSNRVTLFVNKYQELMVDAPPITHFVGLQ